MPNTELINKVVEDIRGKSPNKPDWYVDKNPSSNLLSKVKGKAATLDMGLPASTAIRDVEFDVNKSAIYDRLSDGTYVPKYENYKGAEGNEDRLAREQSGWEQAGSGFVKFLGKTGKNALDATVGTVYGLINGIAKGDTAAIWDNDFSNKMDDWNVRMENALPNYYTDEQKNKGLLASMGTVNFWANDVGDGLAFVAGALLPEMAIGAVTGGATLGVSAGKFAFRAGAKALAKESAEKGIVAAAKMAAKKVDDFTNFSTGRESIRDMYRTSLKSKKAGDIASTTGFLFRTSNFEAGMEARQNLHDAVDTFHSDFRGKNGRPPTLEEMSNFTKDATVAANGVYGANLAILGVSNASMFGKALGVKLPKIGKSTQNFFNKAIGLGTTTLEGGTMVASKANKAQRLIGNTYKVLSKPAMEGIYEEGLQGVAGKTMQNYLEKKYDPNANHSLGIWADMTDALAEQYGTKEGWKEMGIGMIIGMAGPLMSGQAPSGFGKDSRKSREGQIANDVEKVNKGIETLRSMDRASSANNFRNVMESGAESFESTSAENTMGNIAFIQSQEHIKNTTAIQKDYDATIDSMEFDDAQAHSILESGSTAELYKDSLKAEFKQNLDDYTFAKKAVASVGLENVADLNRGDRATMKDAMIMNLVLGQGGLQNSKNIADQLDKIISPPVQGQDLSGMPKMTRGIFDHLQFYNGLGEDKKKSVQELRAKQRSLKTLQDKNLIYQQELAGLQARPKNRTKDSSVEKAINKTAEKATLARNQIIKLQTEVTELEDILKDSFTASAYDLNGTVASNPTNILATIEEIDKLDKYTDALRRTGKSREADSIDYLVDQFKFHSDNHREMMNAHRRMLDTNFFSTKEGSKLRNLILGKPYKMSDEFRQLIKDNDAKIDASLGLVGIRGYEKVEDIINSNLVENEELSDREKYRLESMIRIQLNMDKLQERVNDITKINSEETLDTEESDPLVGDTVLTKKRIDIKEEDLNNIEVLNKVIEEITDQLDYARSTVNKEKIADLEFQLAELKKQKKESNEKPTENKPEEKTPEQKSADNYYVVNQKGKGFAVVKNDDYVVDEDGQVVWYETSEEAQKQKNTLENASKENNQKESTINNGAENQGTDTRQQENGQSTGEQRNTSTNESDNSNSGIPSQVQLDEEIKALEEKIREEKKDTRIIDSPEIIRLTELLAKRDADEISSAEDRELDQLEESVNDWMLITGTVIDGFRLSDLIRQKSILENTPIADNEAAVEVTPDDIIKDVTFEDNEGRANYNYAQSPDSVTAIKKDGKITISGISAEDLDIIVGGDLVYELSKDDKKNIILTEEEIERINNGGKVSILPTNKDLATTYSVVIEFEKTMAGETVGKPLKSPHSTDFFEVMDTDAIYNIDIADEVSFEVDPRDSWNIGLFKKFKTNTAGKKGTPETIEKELEKLRVGLVVRVRANVEKTAGKVENKFVAVLKAKNPTGNKTEEDYKFEEFRTIIVDKAIAAGIMKATEPITIVTDKVAVANVLVGHPNFNFKSNDQGEVSIEYKRIESHDIKKIVDIGFIEDGKLQTKSNVKGVITTFLKKSIDKKTKEKIPFIVIEKEGKRIAYPIRVIPNTRPDNTELMTIFNSKDLTITDKVVKLNKILAGRGIDIKVPGSAFSGIGKTNLNQNFLDQKLAQLDKIDYLRPLSEWISKEDNMEEILQEQVLVNINLSNPFHSPKLKLDYSEAYKGITVPEGKVISKKASKKSQGSTKVESILSKGKDSQKEDC